MNKFLGILLVFAIAFLLPALGYSLFGPVSIIPALLGAAFIVLGLQAITGWPLIPSKFLRMGHNALFATIGVGVLALFMGAFTAWGFAPPTGLLPTGSIVGPTQVPVQPSQPGQPLLVTDSTGRTATVLVFAEDRENAVPTTRTGGALARVYVNGLLTTTTGSSAADSSTTSSNGGTVAGTAVGSTVQIYGGNGSYYVDYQTVPVTLQSQNIPVSVHAATTTANLQTTCYDSSGTVLGTGLNSTEEDYAITMGASQRVPFSCKISPQGANTAYNLFGIATAAKANINDVRLTSFRDVTSCQYPPCSGSTSFNSATMPLFLSKAAITDAVPAVAPGGQLHNTTGYTRFYQFSQPILLHNFDEYRYNFEIESGAANPARSGWFNNTGGIQDMGIVCFFDGLSVRDLTGNEVTSVSTRDLVQGDVGVPEDYFVPQGLDACAVIETP